MPKRTGTLQQLQSPMPAAIPADLHAYLLLQITIEARDEEATRQALRHAATALPEQQGHKVVGVLSRTLPGKSRNWLSRL